MKSGVVWCITQHRPNANQCTTQPYFSRATPKKKSLVHSYITTDLFYVVRKILSSKCRAFNTNIQHELFSYLPILKYACLVKVSPFFYENERTSRTFKYTPIDYIHSTERFNMPRVFVNCMKNNLADERRARFNKQTFKPLPLKERKWNPINKECPICLVELDENGKQPDTRLVCYGSTQCEHTFHKKCIAPWLKKSRHCPLCKDSGGVIGKLESNNKNVVLIKMEDETKNIPHLMVIDAFFSPKLANLKINAITFIEQEGSVEGSRYLQKKHDIHIDVCNKKYCKSKQCKHMIATPLEFVEWYNGIPKSLRHSTMKLKNIVKNVMIPVLLKHAPHIYEHLFDLVSKDENLRRYEYNIHGAAQR